MPPNWDFLESGPPDAAHTALLLPGGSCAARSYELVMTDPALRDVRLVATTLPGNAGAPLGPDNHTIPAMAAEATAFAKAHGCDVLVGFSHGASVALEMVLSGQFTGPTVLLGISLTTPDESAFFRRVVRLSQRIGPFPMKALMWATELIIRTANIEPSHAKKLRADARANRSRDITRICAAYVDYLESEDPAGRLVATGVPSWVVHAEKNSDGGLTDAERHTLDAAPQITLVTIPGSAFLLPNEVPDQIAAVIAAAVANAG